MKVGKDQSGDGDQVQPVGSLECAKKLAFDPGSNTCFCQHAAQLASRWQRTRVIYLCNRESYFTSFLCIFVRFGLIGKVYSSILIK